MTTPTLKPCVSSAISAHGYDPATQTLYLQFKSGGIYSYPEVSTDLYAGLTEAESVGRFYASNIKGQYEARPVPRQAEAASESEGGEA